MPLVYISVLKGKPRDYIRTISNGVHEALVETYKVPIGDHFQLIHQHERGELVYDADYLDVTGPRTWCSSASSRENGATPVTKWPSTAPLRIVYQKLPGSAARHAGSYLAERPR
jgi:Tautomerase enzyme